MGLDACKYCFAAPVVVAMDLPLLGETEDPVAPRLAAAASPWPGLLRVYREMDDGELRFDIEAQTAATLGYTTNAFVAGPEARWDEGMRLLVRLSQGELSSRTKEAVLAGANRAAVEWAPGIWEVFQFRDAELVGERLYALTGLLRGVAGTEDAMAAGVLAEGARFVLLDGASVALPMDLSERGQMLNWRIGPTTKSPDSASYASLSGTFEARGLRPLSPVHVTGERSADRDIVIRWIRRTRIGGDDWDGVDVPLGEEKEAYALDLLHPVTGTLLRSVDVAAPEWTYQEADQIADLGTTSFDTLRLRVAQISQSVGRGTARETMIHV